MSKGIFESATTTDFMYMLFVEFINGLLGTPGKYNWFKMTKNEKKKWKKLADNFKYPDEDPDWME